MLERWRACDGACCRAMPLRDVGGDCYFRDPSEPERGCTAMSTPERLEEMTDEERGYFELACLNWPQNVSPEIQGDFGDCCWRWADGTD